MLPNIKTWNMLTSRQKNNLILWVGAMMIREIGLANLMFTRLPKPTGGRVEENLILSE